MMKPLEGGGLFWYHIPELVYQRHIIMKKKGRDGFFAGILAACIFLAVSGCGRAPQRGAVLATIGDTKITVSDFNERIANLPARYRDIVRKRKGEYLQGLVNDTLLYQEAVRKNIHKDKDVQKVIEEAKKKILIARMLKDEVDDVINVTEEDIRDFYNSNRNKYMSPEVMRVSHILLPSKEEAENILEELAGGACFEDMARAKSVDPTAQQAGDIGYFPRGQLMPEFEDACARLDIGEISGVVKTKLGYHIIKLTDRRNPQIRPLEQVTDSIKSHLRTIKRQKLFNELLERLRQSTTVEIDEDALSMQESGN
ncbi:MAG: hypothetical protein DRP85_01275 [Candidatus Makaraimicrobium thalassicum]|nr:MAG: hypothetical protein DRP85_01275 [Candidatus Omnitrophota bacterium]